MNMNRRDFSLAAAVLAAGPTAVLTPLSAQAQVAKPQAGRDYQVLDQSAAVEAPAGKIEVVEFFSYMCPHCNSFEPTISAWMKALPKHVAVRRVPVHFLPNAEVLQRTYYALETLTLLEKLHAVIFVAVHTERRDFKTPAIMADWLATQGVDKAKFMDQYNSFTTATKVARATQLTNAYKVEGVPAMGVAGRFLTEGTAKGLRVVDALVADIKAGR